MKLFEELKTNEAYNQLRFNTKIKEHIYHYTNLDGLFGILDSNEFWLSDVRFMNDPSDSGDYVINLINEIIEEEDKDTYKSHNLSSFIYFLKEKIKQEIRLVACFSTSVDKLSQWRAYGGKEINYCLEIDPLLFFKSLPVEFYVWHIEYDKQIQKNLISEVFKSSTKLILEGKYTKEEDDVFMKELIITLSLLTQNFKHPKYFEEDEFRLTYADTFDIEKNYTFRKNNGFVVPFKNFKFDKKSIKRIFVENKADAQLAKLSLEKFLIKKDYSAECIISEIPRR